MNVLYTDNDPKCCQWLENLVAAGQLPPGRIICRDIREFKPADFDGFKQVHHFCGIGGWPYALKLAEWPEDGEVWTCSCPCQPFSCAGDQQGESDARHLWPDLRNIIAIRKPPVCFGEQVASKLGRDWLSRVRADLEALGYGVGASDLCSAGVGAPHIRQRLFWVAVSSRQLIDGEMQSRPGRDGSSNGSIPGGMAWSNAIWHYCRDGKYRRTPESPFFGMVDGLSIFLAGGGLIYVDAILRNLSLADCQRSQGEVRAAAFLFASMLRQIEGPSVDKAEHWKEVCSGAFRGLGMLGLWGDALSGTASPRRKPSKQRTFKRANRLQDLPQKYSRCEWDLGDWPCTDEQMRCVWKRLLSSMSSEARENLLATMPQRMGFPLCAEKVENRVGLLRGFGNAITPAVAAQFIQAAREAMNLC